MTEKGTDRRMYKGNFIFAPAPDRLETIENGYLLVEDGIVKSLSRTHSEREPSIPLEDFGDHLILPGFVDLHFHASQLNQRGLGLDRELLPWLENYIFPEEAKFSDPAYGKEVYQRSVKALARYGTTRSVVFATIHLESTKILFDLFEQSGLGAYIGKVNMDRNSPDYLRETFEQSIKDTLEFTKDFTGGNDLVNPIITPRFVPTCSGELLKDLGDIARNKKLPVQSHIAENLAEIDWVKELHPTLGSYANVYEAFGLFGDSPTIMAHCVYNSDEDISLMAKNRVFAAHCPYANLNLSSGLMPVRKYLDHQVPLGLGSDVGAGHEVSIPKVMVAAIQSSKILWLNSSKKLKPLNLVEVFYLGTKGGGEFFGQVGSFEEGYEFDALVIDDGDLGTKDLTLEERLQRYIYIGDDRHIQERFVRGKRISL